MQTWPEDWADQRRGIGCPFCAEGRPDENSDGVRIYSSLCVDAYLSRHHAQPGYTVVVWRGRGGVTVDEDVIRAHPPHQIYFNLFAEDWQLRQAKRSVAAD
jgi:hypothetical protein